MSIVERALRKVQGSARTVPNQRFGRVVEAGTNQAVVSGAIRPTRTISIDQAALRAAGLLAPSHQERQIANQYRQIKRPLIAGAIGRGKQPLPNGQLIMVASALPGEGKTFTALNLALSMAMEKDLQILLVDADVAKPQISKMFGVLGEPGLLDALADDSVAIEQYVMPTDVPNLSLLPAGRRSDLATELLSSERMKRVTADLSAGGVARVVVFDSPPLLLTTESHALAYAVGQIVVVVHAGHTEQHTVMEALDHLPEEAAISMVLNQSVGRNPGAYYYSYGTAGDQEKSN